MYYSYYLEWLLFLFVSIVVVAFYSAVIPAFFRRTHHPFVRTLNEFITHHQIAFLPYYIGIFLLYSGRDGLILLSVLGALLVTLLLAIVAAKLAAPGHEKDILRSINHRCPREPYPKCHQRISFKTVGRICGLNCLIFVISVLIAVLLPFVLTLPTPVTQALPTEVVAYSSQGESLGLFAESIEDKTRYNVVIDPKAKAFRVCHNFKGDVKEVLQQLESLYPDCLSVEINEAGRRISIWAIGDFTEDRCSRCVK